VLLALALAAAVAPVAGADAATVTTTEDGGAGSLRQAIADAVPGETVTVPSGTYTLTEGELTIAKSLTIAGAGPGATVISGAKSSRVFLVDAEGAAVTISGVTVTNGAATESFVTGAGIKSVGTDLTLRDDAISGNVATAPEGGTVFGGALSAEGGDLTIADTTVAGNLADAGGGDGQPGGFVAGAGVQALVQTLTIERSTIANNRADARGGQDPSLPGQNGGSVFGAGLAANTARSLVIADSTISGNVAASGGGPGGEGGFALGVGVSLVGGVKNQITQITVSGNVARAGEAGTVLGGGMRFATTEPIEIASSTIVGNSTGDSSQSLGGNVFVEVGDVRFTDSILADGIGPAGSENCAAQEPDASILSGGFNLESGTDCGFGAGGDIAGTDPLLGSLADNGGATQTMLPAAASPAIDQGGAGGLRADQRGAPRVVDDPAIPNSAAPGADGSDIGSVEVQASR
jgi:hypothetical protein